MNDSGPLRAAIAAGSLRIAITDAGRPSAAVVSWDTSLPNSSAARTPPIAVNAFGCHPPPASFNKCWAVRSPIPHASMNGPHSPRFASLRASSSRLPARR